MMKRPHSYISNTEATLILALALLILVSFDLITGVFLKLLFSTSSYNFSHQLERTNSDTIILGSSTAARGIDPAVLDSTLGTKTFSFAKDGTGIFYATSVLRNIPKTHKLRYVIFGIDPASFVSGFSSSNFRQIERLLPYASQDSLLKSYLSYQTNWLDVKLISLSYPYIYVGKEILKDKIREFLPSHEPVQNGFWPLNGVIEPKDKIEQTDRLKSATRIYSISTEAEVALAAIEAEINERGAKLVLVTLPLYNQELRSIKSENTVVMTKIKTMLRSEYLCDLSSLYSDELSLITLNHQMFYDGAHLNKDGAAQFTYFLADHIKQLCT